MLSRKIIPTQDGSSTIFISEWDESYHSRHGAIQEAYHVFIRNGLDMKSDQNELSILEIGLGTGLNALITFLESVQNNLQIKYTGIEKYPISETEFASLNYAQSLLNIISESGFELDFIQENYFKIMQADWNKFQEISPQFSINKIQADFLDFDYPNSEFDMVYFDAFGARVQPELWEESLFEKIVSSMKPGAVFTTYSAKGSVRRALKSVGLEVEKRPGPPGKREMLVGRKLI